ncbi:flagellar hook-basal body complex protein FliE [Patulibacter sp. NPDC049589]|uniref:flagellar hook-basal body complex protein FliE n=1 Tax=Patulibacter sp. NPDC049589 TaxID=3154731 RepID=UPI00343F4D8D
MIAPIDPSIVLGPQASIAGVGPLPQPDGAAVTGADGGGFGATLSNAVKSLETTQAEAAKGAQELAAGTATSPEAVVMGVERAKLAMQLASSLRTKGVEAMNDILHTQV